MLQSRLSGGHEANNKTMSISQAEMCVTLQELGFSIVSTGGTGKHLKANGVDCEIVLKIQEGRPNIGDLVKNGEIAMMLITSTGVCTLLSCITAACAPLQLFCSCLNPNP